MITIEIERTLTDAFQGGACRRRELRLTREEADYIAGHFPVHMTAMSTGEKAWYEITFQGVGV